MLPGVSLGQSRGACFTGLERKQVQACLRVGVSLGSVEFEVPVQLEIQELEHPEGESGIGSTWRVSEAIE